MKKRYLKSVEDVLALKDTDVKIYAERIHCYYQFVNGILCENVKGKFKYINSVLCLEDKPYILEEEPMQEVTEEDVGKLCKFYDDEYSYVFRILYEIYVENEYSFVDETGENWKHCRRLTPSEVAEITGYKVSFADQRDAKVEEAE